MRTARHARARVESARSPRLRRAGALLFLSVLCSYAWAAEPSLKHLYPAAGQQGTTVAVTAVGKFDEWPPEAWVDAPGVLFKPAKTKGKFDVEIAADAPAGPHLVRFYTAAGSSAPRFFIVSGTPESLDTEPNDHFNKPQKIASLPATISGRLDKAGDVDSFALSLKKNEPLTASVQAYVLGSTFDGMLRIVDEQGTQLAFNHDGKTLDPHFTWRAPHDGTFIVQIMGFVYPATSGVGLTGGEGCIYRLHFTPGAGGNELPKGELPAQAEKEPNNDRAAAQTVAVPGAIAGAIQQDNDEDRFLFTATKQRLYDFRLIGARAGSAIDGWLKIESKEGKELARNDDAGGSRDPQLIWKAPAGGEFIVAIGDVTHRGGDDYVYRLDAREAAPSITGTTANPSLMVKAGASGEVKVAIKRANGFSAKLQLAAKDLPDGVSAPEIDVPDKDSEVTLKVKVDDTVAGANQPFRVVLREKEGGKEHPVRHPMITSGDNNGVPQGYTELVIDSTDLLWLTVPPNPKAKPATPPAEPPATPPEPAKPAS